MASTVVRAGRGRSACPGAGVRPVRQVRHRRISQSSSAATAGRDQARTSRGSSPGNDGEDVDHQPVRPGEQRGGGQDDGGEGKRGAPASGGRGRVPGGGRAAMPEQVGQRPRRPQPRQSTAPARPRAGGLRGSPPGLAPGADADDRPGLKPGGQPGVGVEPHREQDVLPFVPEFDDHGVGLDFDELGFGGLAPADQLQGAPRGRCAWAACSARQGGTTQGRCPDNDKPPSASCFQPCKWRRPPCPGRAAD